MKPCEEYRDQLIEAYYGELSGQEKEELSNHLSTCTLCAAEYRKLESTLSIMNKRTRTEPDEAYWKNYWSTLNSSLLQEKVQQQNKKQEYQSRFGIFPSWAYGIAALLLIGVGLYFGKVLFGVSPEQDVPTFSVQTPPSTTDSVHQKKKDDSEQTSKTDLTTQLKENTTSPSLQPEQRKQHFANRDNLSEKQSLQAIPVRSETETAARSYLNRSKIMLLGLINSDSDEELPSLSQQQRVSRSLLKEAADLKPKLVTPDQQRVKQLIEELEVILLQLANIEEQADLPAVELVKKGVDQKAILLKINLEEMRTMKHKKTGKKSGSSAKQRL